MVWRLLLFQTRLENLPLDGKSLWKSEFVLGKLALLSANIANAHLITWWASPSYVTLFYGSHNWIRFVALIRYCFSISEAVRAVDPRRSQSCDWRSALSEGKHVILFVWSAREPFRRNFLPKRACDPQEFAHDSCFSLLLFKTHTTHTHMYVCLYVYFELIFEAQKSHYEHPTSWWNSKIYFRTEKVCSKWGNKLRILSSSTMNSLVRSHANCAEYIFYRSELSLETWQFYDFANEW